VRDGLHARARVLGHRTLAAKGIDILYPWI
jgi:hypothetical protein